MRYKSDYCFVTKDLYDNFNVKEISLKKHCSKDKSKKEMIASILMYCLYLIILDIIKNNITFVLPLFGDQEACFYVKSFNGDTFKTMYNGGCFSGIDFLNSNFKGYQIYFQYTYKGGVREKPIYISNNLKSMFYENINQGKQYY